jgi:hypothetical protein
MIEESEKTLGERSGDLDVKKKELDDIIADTRKEEETSLTSQ